MIEEHARVVEAQGEHAWVETQRKGACGSCSASGGCGTATLSQVMGRKTARVRVANPLGAKAGDEVVIGIPEGALLKGSFAMYAVPVLAMMIAAWAGTMLAGDAAELREPISIAFGLAGLGGGFLWLRRYAGRIGRDSSYEPVILRRAGGSPVVWLAEGLRQKNSNPEPAREETDSRGH